MEIHPGIWGIPGYVDPGSGGLLLQLMLGGLAGVGLFFKLLWRRVKAAPRKDQTVKKD